MIWLSEILDIAINAGLDSNILEKRIRENLKSKNYKIENISMRIINSKTENIFDIFNK